MPGKKKLASFVEKRFVDMRESLEKFSTEIHQEDLHKFRVAVKKVRMVIRLLDYMGGSKKVKKAYKPLKEVFQGAGDVRNSFIILKLLGKYGLKDAPIAKRKQKELETLSRQFIAQKQSYLDLIDKAEKMIAKCLHKIKHHELELYIQSGLHKAALSLQAAPGRDKLHKMRGQIKTIGYSLTLLEHDRAHFPGPNADYLDKMQSCIGDWHDADSVIQLAEVTRLSAKVKDRVNKESGRLYQKALSMGRNFMDKAFTPVHKLSVK